MPSTAQLDRTVVIRARPATIFRFFTDPARWAAWWGGGSSIDARPGGRMLIRYPNGVEAAGEVVEVVEPERIVFTYGYVAGTPIPAGASRVTIRLEAVGRATKLHLVHEFEDGAVRDAHVQGWRYQLSVFSNVVADEVNAGAANAVDAWFDAWAQTDADQCRQRLVRIAADEVRLRDRFGNIDGLDELVPHVAASQRFMPGIRMTREGDVQHCQGTVLATWVARSTDGHERARGTNVFEFDADGRIRSVVGFVTR
jgi:uncharacterized protein YndB with AHSA1/START domain